MADSAQRPNPAQFSCPLPPGQPAEIQLGHGGGGRLTQQLIDSIFAPAFDNPALAAAHDGAVLADGGGRWCFSTDAHVVSPIFFPGGDIGGLSVHGTCNDVAMCGAQPKWLSAAFILEEGLPIKDLQAVVASMREAAREIGVQIVAGDTKVVERGKAEKLYITTSGIGESCFADRIEPRSVQPGDAIILSGDIGCHGMAIMAQREGLAFESPIKSDSAHLWHAVEAMVNGRVNPHCMRDLTRGGLATSLIEIARTSGFALRIEESAIPVSDPVRGACEVLGLDPLYVANEGRMVVFAPADEVDRTVQFLRSTKVSRDSKVIGTVLEEPDGRVRLRGTIGVERVLDRQSGEQLPRIC